MSSRLPNPVQVQDKDAERPVHVEEMHATLGDALGGAAQVRSRIDENIEAGARSELKEAAMDLKKSLTGLMKSLQLVAKAATAYARIRGGKLHLPAMPSMRGASTAKSGPSA